MKLFTLILLVCFSTCSLANNAIEQLLNKYHESAANADFDGYLGAMAEHSVFIGTDASERWSKAEFSDFVSPYFNKGIGWKYVPFERNITLLEGGEIAYFDELLNNSSYGICRGTGVVVLHQGQWQIAQYSLSIPIPNAIAKPVVKLIAEAANKEAPND